MGIYSCIGIMYLERCTKFPKIEKNFEKLAKNPKMYTHTFTNDDMTLAQLVTRELLLHPHVTFAACRKRHPLESNIDLCFSVKENIDESALLNQCINNLYSTFQHLYNDLENIQE
jgi:DNA-directed RNA polymerase subunit L